MLDRAHHRPGALSGGQKQCVAIARAIYFGAKVIILDEPTAVLVPQEVDELFGNLRELKREGITVLFISHKLDEVLSVADTVTVIRRGTTIDTVLPQDVTARQLAERNGGRLELVQAQPAVFCVFLSGPGSR